MSGSLNKVTIIGNLGADPEIRSNNNDGRELATFSLATTERWRDKATGEQKDRTEWHRVVVFSEGLVKVIKNYVKKGSKLYIEGSLQTRKWTDNNNIERYTTEIVLQNYNSTLVMLDSRSGSNESYNLPDAGQAGGSNQGSSNGGSNNFKANELDDNIPF